MLPYENNNNSVEKAIEAQNTANFVSSVPKLELTDNGFIAPDQQAILTGILTDFQNAFGANLNTDLRTPQGQLAMSLTAILGNCEDQLLDLFSNFDPATASGRMQDALGNIYFMTRRPATYSTVDVNCVLTGGGNTLSAGTIIAVDNNGNEWTVPENITLPLGVSATITLQCQTAGAITAGSNTLYLYQGGLGISSLSNPEPARIGDNIESRADFEGRRQKMVANASKSQNASILGGLYNIPTVTDAYVIDNPTPETLDLDGISIPPWYCYIVVAGGTKEEIGQVILNKKCAGVPTLGKSEVTVTDNDPLYGDNPPSYTYYYDVPEAVPLYINVSLAKLPQLPNDILQRVQNVIVEYLTNANTRIGIGDILYASRLSAAVDSLGDYCEVMDLTIGTTKDAGKKKLRLPISQTIGIDPNNITLTLDDGDV